MNALIKPKLYLSGIKQLTFNTSFTMEFTFNLPAKRLFF